MVVCKNGVLVAVDALHLACAEAARGECYGFDFIHRARLLVSCVELTSMAFLYPASDRLLIKMRYGMKDRLNGHFIPNSRVDHEVEELSGRPFYVEILLDVCRTVLIHGLDKLNSFVFGFARGDQPMYLLLKRSVDEDMQSVGALVEMVGCAAPNDNRIAFLSNVRNHLLRDLSNAIGIY